MATEFSMPKLGLTMEEGTILQWLVPDGGEVTAGMPVLIVATDKVETEVECPGGGRLAQTGSVGSTYRCGEPIGWLLAPGESAPSAAGGAASPGAASTPHVGSPTDSGAGPSSLAAGPSVTIATASGGRPFISPNARRVAAELGVDVTTVVGTGPNGRVVSEDVEAVAAAGAPRVAASAPSMATRAVASVAASQLADLVGVDLGRATISASGPDGRISRQDVADHVRSALTTPTAATSATGAPASMAFALTQTPSSVIAMRGMRGTIASRMHQSLQQMAQLTLTMDVDMDAVWADRERRKAAGTPPGFTDYVIAAVAQALRSFPTMNSQVTADGIAVLPDVHVGMAVALGGGLVVPVVRHTDRLRLDAIGAETARLAAAARGGKLALADLEGGTFSVTSLGMYGVDAFTPVINPPNAGILGVGRIRDEVVWVGDAIRRARRMTLSLTWDHRVLDGAPAAEFCQAVKANLEDPTRIP